MREKLETLPNMADVQSNDCTDENLSQRVPRGPSQKGDDTHP